MCGGRGITAKSQITPVLSQGVVDIGDAATTFTGGPMDQSAIVLASFEAEVAKKVGASRKRTGNADELPPAKRPAGGKGISSLAIGTAPKSAAKPKPVPGPIEPMPVISDLVVEVLEPPPAVTYGFRHPALDESPAAELDSELEEKVKHKKHKKSQKKTKSKKGGKASKKRKSKKQTSSSESSSSSDSSSGSSMSSLFRGASANPHGQDWNSMKARADKYPGRMAAGTLQRFADLVGRDGVAGRWKRMDTPPCAQAFYNRVVASEGAGGIPSQQRRDRRECETLCLMLDKWALGEYPGVYWMPASGL